MRPVYRNLQMLTLTCVCRCHVEGGGGGGGVGVLPAVLVRLTGDNG